MTSSESVPPTEPAPLEELMQAYIAGSLPAFDELYRRTSPRVFGYLLTLCRQRARAEDLLQVTYAKMHRARGSYLAGAALMPWLLAIARRAFLDDQRARKRRPEDLTPAGDVPEQGGTADGGSPISSELRAALDQLPPQYREAIELTKVAGLTVSEAAQVLGATESAVKLRLHRGYERLRRSFDTIPST